MLYSNHDFIFTVPRYHALSPLWVLANSVPSMHAAYCTVLMLTALTSQLRGHCLTGVTTSSQEDGPPWGPFTWAVRVRWAAWRGVLSMLMCFPSESGSLKGVQTRSARSPEPGP